MCIISTQDFAFRILFKLWSQQNIKHKDKLSYHVIHAYILEAMTMKSVFDVEHV